MNAVRLSTWARLAVAGLLLAGLSACDSDDDSSDSRRDDESPSSEASTSLEGRPELEFRQVVASTGLPGACQPASGGLGRSVPFADAPVRAVAAAPGDAPQPTAEQCAALTSAPCAPADEDSGTSVSAGNGWTIACVEQSGSPYSYLLAPPDFTSAVVDADVDRPDQQPGWVIQVELPDAGARDFADVTRTLAGTQRQLAVVLDGNVLTAPVIQSVITDGMVWISGDFSENSAKDLADKLEGDD